MLPLAYQMLKNPPRPPRRRRPSLRPMPAAPLQCQFPRLTPEGYRKDVMEFEKIRAIGRGLQGECWLMESSDGTLVVRKVLEEWPRDGQRPLEVRILKEILPAHRSILDLHYWSKIPEKRRVHMYYEYCYGGSLDCVIPIGEPGNLRESFIWHVFVHLAEALEVLHHLGTQKVVHRDIKPENVFLESPFSPTQSRNSYPDVRLGDFGLATLSPVTSGSGTYMWMGPEVPKTSAKGDVYSLGGIIHALAHGKAPIDHTLKNWETNPYARAPRSLPRRYSNALNDNMMRCLKRDPHKRPSSRELVLNLHRDRR